MFVTRKYWSHKSWTTQQTAGNGGSLIYSFPDVVVSTISQLAGIARATATPGKWEEVVFDKPQQIYQNHVCKYFLPSNSRTSHFFIHIKQKWKWKSSKMDIFVITYLLEIKLNWGFYIKTNSYNQKFQSAKLWICLEILNFCNRKYVKIIAIHYTSFVLTNKTNSYLLYKCLYYILIYPFLSTNTASTSYSFLDVDICTKFKYKDPMRQVELHFTAIPEN